MMKKNGGLIKGVPSAVFVSALIHLILLLLAGGFVVFTIIDKKEAQFVPPVKIDRPKMQLKKMRVKMKDPVKPPSTQRIAVKNSPTMPDIQLPDVSGGGGASGLGGGLGGYELMPDVSDISLFGGANPIAVGNDFEGYFYSLAYDRRGNEISANKLNVLKQFCESDWNPLAFAPYYRSSNKMYTTHFVIPSFLSNVGPRSFGIIDPDFNPLDWVVHYKGTIASPKDGHFRFWGFGDEVLLVRINKKVVLDASWTDYRGDITDWRPDSDEDRKYPMGHGAASVGSWFDLKAGEPVAMEVLLEENGGLGGFILAIEDDDEDYDRNRDGMPVLPAFKTAEFAKVMQAQIEYSLIRGDVDLNAALMFNVH